MDIQDFITQYALGPDSIDGTKALDLLLKQMELGLSGRGNIPMIPSYLSPDTVPEPGVPCCVLDAGGTNLRLAKAVFDENRSCHLSGLHKEPMPGTGNPMTAREFYDILADRVRKTGCVERIGFCFSYNVLQERNLDGILQAWCKEIRVPDAPGKPVGDSLKQAVGPDCQWVRVLNDSTAALLGAHWQDPGITLGLILGTGINICYCEPCDNIPKVPGDLAADSMIISTEIGEFDGFPKNEFEKAVILASDEPELAHAEKQCAGAYLGRVIHLAWQEAAQLGLIPTDLSNREDLAWISEYLTDAQADSNAVQIAGTMIHRAAKIAAVLTAGPIIRSCQPGRSCALVIEGSQYHKLTGFGEAFRKELEVLLRPCSIHTSLRSLDNSCLTGAALAAFAHPM